MSAISERDEKGRIKKGGSIGGKTSTSFKPTEETNPDAAAALIALAGEDPEATIKRLAEQCGLGTKATKALLEKMQTRWQPLAEEVKRVTSDSLIGLIEEKLPLLLGAIDKKKVNDATLRDIAVAFGVLAEKRQLLKGEPTQIMTYEERRNMNEIGPALLKELDRRGLVVDVSFQEVSEVNVLAPDELPIEALSKTAQGMGKRTARAKARR